MKFKHLLGAAALTLAANSAFACGSGCNGNPKPTPTPTPGSGQTTQQVGQAVGVEQNVGVGVKTDVGVHQGNQQTLNLGGVNVGGDKTYVNVGGDKNILTNEGNKTIVTNTTDLKAQGGAGGSSSATGGNATGGTSSSSSSSSINGVSPTATASTAPVSASNGGVNVTSKYKNINPVHAAGVAGAHLVAPGVTQLCQNFKAWNNGGWGLGLGGGEYSVGLSVGGKANSEITTNQECLAQMQEHELKMEAVRSATNIGIVEVQTGAALDQQVFATGGDAGKALVIEKNYGAIVPLVLGNSPTAQLLKQFNNGGAVAAAPAPAPVAPPKPKAVVHSKRVVTSQPAATTGCVLSCPKKQ